MIQLSLRGKIQYQFLSLIVLLLISYAIGFLLESLYQLPDNPLAQFLSQAAIARFTAQAFKLLALSGFVAGGLMMQSTHPSEPVLLRMQRGWYAVAVLTLATSPFVTSQPLDLALALVLLAPLAISRSASEQTAFLGVWQIGMLLITLCLSTWQLAGGKWMQVIQLFQLHVAFGICALSLVFWLMQHFSKVEPAWKKDGLRIVALLVILGGSLISIASLGLAPLISLSATPLVLLPFMILAGHHYRALSMRSAKASLAAHWIALATLFWLVAGGFLGAISIQAGINKAMQGTALSQAQGWLMGWVLLAIVLAFVNAQASELRGDNRRVTGYMPLWLIGFGVALSSIVGACRGLLEIYLRDIFGLEAASILELLLPLTLIWIICLLAVGLGIIFYALGFWLRRPKIQVIPR